MRACRGDWYQPWLNMGLCVGMQGMAKQAAGNPLADQNYRRAQACFEKAISYDDSTFQVWLNLGLSLEHQGEIKLALGDRPAALVFLPGRGLLPEGPAPRHHL